MEESHEANPAEYVTQDSSIARDATALAVPEDREQSVDGEGIETKEAAASKQSGFTYYLTFPAVWLRVLWVKHRKTLKYIIYSVLILAYFAYLIAACVLKWDLAHVLLILTIIVLIFVAWELVQKFFGERLNDAFQPLWNFNERFGHYVHMIFWAVCVALIVVWLVIDCRHNPRKLIGLLGIFVFLYACMLCSSAPGSIKWRPVAWGMLLSFAIALFVFRTKPGQDFFSFLSDNISKFLDFTNYGADFLFGDLGKDDYSMLGVFAFRTLPIIIYFSGVVGLLYYTGFMEYVINKITWLMVHTLNTTGPETMVAAGNIFVGQTEAPLLIRPFLQDMSCSELVAVMASGMGSISGSVLGAYIAFGIPATDLVTACVVSAPTTLAVCKIIYPETEVSKHAKFSKALRGAQSDCQNFIEAFAGGAAAALPLALNVGANLIAFVSILYYLDSLLSWLGEMVTITNPPLTVDRLLGWIFYPFAWLMTVDTEDLSTAGRVIGKRIFLNEFVAFQDMGALHDNRINGLPKYDADGTLQWISARSESVLTYAIAGFANIGSMGIMMGGLTPMAPSRSKDIAKTVVVALVAANMACFVRASLAGLLYDD